MGSGRSASDRLHGLNSRRDLERLVALLLDDAYQLEYLGGGETFSVRAQAERPGLRVMDAGRVGAACRRSDIAAQRLRGTTLWERQAAARVAFLNVVSTGSGVPPPERQIQSGAILRVEPGAKKVSPAVTQIHPTALEEFKNAYSLEFLSLPGDHSEADLHGALLRNLGSFRAELGRDFCFVGSKYSVQVGNQDFEIDLVFFHRALQCLVAIELKVDKFKPADLGQLSFYVEALDRDVKKAHERPSIGMLLCATKDDEVVEYALARTASPTSAARSPHRRGRASELLFQSARAEHSCAATLGMCDALK